MSTLITDTNAVLTFTGQWARQEMADYIASAMSCEEIDALYGLLYAMGELAAADMWMAAHARNAEPGDRHYRTSDAQYAVPVDPIDLLQCDSCQ
ncbi:hypothetical protein HII28_16150 [Planctomonas sp. JC2975]|uniref:hypothetical protein n=1 Tax=Planctomonas sp. JC2975 TaxID=2729626 RepID=UPI00147642C7|nr:hypothetical protein [Planctomonas sp. JC2975]NNC13404.1 hypothetical protein [Planctomonas sp. JC2975]